MTCKDPDHLECPVKCEQCDEWCELDDLDSPDPDRNDDFQICPECRKKYKTFLVTFHVDATGYMRVIAKDEEQAKEIAESDFCPDMDNTEIGDAQEIVGCRLANE